MRVPAQLLSSCYPGPATSAATSAIPVAIWRVEVVEWWSWSWLGLLAGVVGWGLSDVTTEYTKEKEKKGLRHVSAPFIVDVRWWNRNKKKHTWARDVRVSNPCHHLPPLPCPFALVLAS
jgi:hypothetical protein